MSRVQSIARFLLSVVVGAGLGFGAIACGSSSPVAPTNSLRVTAVSPAIGSTTGNTSVTISGAGFGADATITVGGVAATGVSVQGTSALTAIVGAHPTAGPGDVIVTSGGRSATLASGFTFVAPSSSNQPPVVTSIRSIGSRAGQPNGFADVNETITLVAGVTDNETPPGSLTYTWSGLGSFAANAATTAWTAPASVSPVPAPVVVTLVVTETFTEGGVVHTQRSAPGAFTLQVHDSQTEILDMGQDFLTRFSNSDLSVDDVLHNFSATCDKGRGRADEAGDTVAARQKYRQDFSRFRITRLPPVTFNFGGACIAFGTRIRPADACSLFTVHWEFTCLVNDGSCKAGDHATSDGRDNVTAVLENNQWRLCHSDFQGAQTNLTSGLTRQVLW